MNSNIQIFAVVFVGVFSATMLAQAAFNSLSAGQHSVTADITEKQREGIDRGMKTAEQKDNSPAAAPAPPDEHEEKTTQETKTGLAGEIKDLCEGIDCGSATEICPDGFKIRCRNFCIPQTGKCTDCKPDCKSHEGAENENPVVQNAKDDDKIEYKYVDPINVISGLQLIKR